MENFLLYHYTVDTSVNHLAGMLEPSMYTSPRVSMRPFGHLQVTEDICPKSLGESCTDC